MGTGQLQDARSARTRARSAGALTFFFHLPEQEAKALIAELNAEKRFPKPIVAQVVSAQTFWRAEAYHLKYLEKRGAANCHI